MDNNNPYFTGYGQPNPNGNPNGNHNGNANGNTNGNPSPNPDEPLSPYHQYSPGTAPPGFMTQQPPRQPSQAMPNAGPQYPTSQYAHTPAQHLPMPPQMDLAPMGSRTQPPQYIIQQPTAPSISPHSAMPFTQQRPDLALPRRATVPTSLTGYGDPRIPRTQVNVGTSEMAAMVRSESSQNSSGSYTKRNSKDEEEKRPPLHSTVPLEVVNLCVTSGDRVCLNERATEEDHHLFNIHGQQRGTRGKGMWDNITNQFYKATGVPRLTTPRLQMKHIRNVRKNFMLPREGFERLCDIYEEDERNRYNRILTAFKEVYDPKYDLKAPELECYFVRLGFESPTMDEATKLRRRCRTNAKREQRNSNAHANAVRNDRNHTPPGATIWNNSYGQIGIESCNQYPLPGPGQHHQHPGHVHPSQSFDFSNGMGAGLNIDQEESLMVGIAIKYNESPLSHGSPDGSTPGSADPNDAGNPMLSDMSSHSRMLPSPNGMLPNGAPYYPQDRNNSNNNNNNNDNNNNTKQEPWK